jgi:LPS sulfotransferase NodH
VTRPGHLIRRLVRAISKGFRPTPVQFEGFHDVAHAHLVAGWARIPNEPGKAVSVEVLLDGDPIGTVKADEFRADLVATGKGDGKHAFSFPLDLQSGETCGCARRPREGDLPERGPKRHTVLARVAGTDVRLGGSPKEIACSSVHPIQMSYIVCASVRSGSTLLCELLRLTGRAGRPSEYFLPNESGWPSGIAVPESRRNQKPAPSEYLQLVLTAGGSRNGVFGMKIMETFFDDVVRRLRGAPGYEELEPSALLAHVFPNLHYVWIRRKDRVRQAVSWAISWQTRVMHEWEGGRSSPVVPLEDVRFDFGQIKNYVQQIDESDACWFAYFAAAGVEPLTVFYEDLVEDAETEIQRVLDYLGIRGATLFAAGDLKLRRQSTSLNDEWVARYLEMAGG